MASKPHHTISKHCVQEHGIISYFVIQKRREKQLHATAVIIWVGTYFSVSTTFYIRKAVCIYISGIQPILQNLSIL